MNCLLNFAQDSGDHGLACLDVVLRNRSTCQLHESLANVDLPVMQPEPAVSHAGPTTANRAKGTAESFGTQPMPVKVAPATRTRSELRVAFVDDEASNRRIGLRTLQQLGVAKENVVLLNDGEHGVFSDE